MGSDHNPLMIKMKIKLKKTKTINNQMELNPAASGRPPYNGEQEENMMNTRECMQ